jgi:hypothetical protein
MASSVRENNGRTRGFAEFLLEQLSSQPVLMDIDILPGAWSSRNTSRRQHWEGEPVADAPQQQAPSEQN